MRHWYVMYTKSHKEALVNEQLEAKGLETYFPYINVERGHRRGTRVEPLFPQYLFFQADLQTNEATGLRTLPGASTIVHSEAGPVVVPPEIVDMLRERVERHVQERSAKPQQFKHGQPLLVKSGPFVGLEAIFQDGLSSHDRAQVMLKFLGQWTRTELSFHNLMPIGSSDMQAW